MILFLEKLNTISIHREPCLACHYHKLPKEKKARSLNYLFRSVAKRLGLKISDLIQSSESEDYGAYQFNLNGKVIQFRIAKTTPTKKGQFVTLWKRHEKGYIEPFHQTDPVDFVIIHTQNKEHHGLFVFAKTMLCQQKIFSVGHREGKRALRLYSPWDSDLNAQAKKTQAWQLGHFKVLNDFHI